MNDDDQTANPPAGEPVDQPAVTGRPQDEPQPNTTFRDRLALKNDSKAVDSDSAEDKSVASRRTARKSK